MDRSHLLSSNTPPEASEIPGIRASLAQLQLERQNLEIQMKEIDEKVNQHLALLSPIRRVPLEILSDIFVLVVLGAPLENLSPSQTRMYPYHRQRLIPLGLVCRDWRHAALITHSFWSYIAVDCQLKGQSSFIMSYDWVGSWLRNQDELPRILEFGNNYGMGATCCDTDQCRYLSTTLGRVLADGPVLDKLILRLGSPECLDKLFSSFPQVESSNLGDVSCPWRSFRQLKHLVLKFEYWIDDYDCNCTASHTIFKYLPPVTKFELYLPMQSDVFDGDEECDEAELNLPRAFLEGLKEFTYSCNWTLRHTAGPLTHCANLEKLVLDFDDHFVEFISPLDRSAPSFERLFSQGITLPKLQTLQVKRSKWKEEIEHIRFIRAPALQNLVVDLDSDGDSYLPEDYARIWWSPFMQHVLCLRTLTLSGLDIAKGALTAMKIQEIPSLVHLTLKTIRSMDELFGSPGPFNNKPTASGGHPFPSLQVLELLDLEHDFDFSLVFKFVKCRRPYYETVINGRGRLVFEGPPDTLVSLIAMYYELDEGLVAKGNFYGMAGILEEAGVTVKIGGPPMPPRTRKRALGRFSVV
ncbi:hypothetical protein NMY22_g14693 [Coprinellus aureogranulatus]|nr:hypothetical protein NMY22_g14693 [Coprinellus aureogranulatus]